MKITYIVLTCDKYFKTRGSKIKQTWGSLVSKEDSLYFLSSTPIPEENVLGYNDPDTYVEVAHKQVSLFINNNFESDWIYLCDDDTFVFPDRLKKLLLNYDPTKEIGVGEIDEPCGACYKSKFDIPFSYSYPNGGAGIAMSKPLFDRYKKFLQGYKYFKYIPYTENGDITLGLWAKLMKFENFVDRKDVLSYFPPDHHIHDNANFDNMVSFHRCTNEQYDMLYSMAIKS